MICCICICVPPQLPTVEAKPRVLAIIDELTKMEEGLKEALREEVCAVSQCICVQ
jgi:hypothetical protein